MIVFCAAPSGLMRTIGLHDHSGYVISGLCLDRCSEEARGGVVRSKEISNSCLVQRLRQPVATEQEAIAAESLVGHFVKLELGDIRTDCSGYDVCQRMLLSLRLGQRALINQALDQTVIVRQSLRHTVSQSISAT